MAWRMIRTALRIAGAAVLLAVAAAVIYAWRQEAYFDRMAEQAAARGLPTTPAEAAARHPAPASDENAGPLYIQAYDTFGHAPSVPEDARSAPWTAEDLPLYGGPRPTPGAPWTEAMRAAAADFLAYHNEAYALLDQAASMAECRFVWDFSRGFALQTYEPGPLSMLVRPVELRIAFALAEGRTGDAVDALRTMAAMTRHAGGDPLPSAHLARFTVSESARNQVEFLLNAAALDDAQLHALLDAFAGEPAPGALAESLAAVLPIALSRTGLENIAVPGTPAVSDPFLRAAGTVKRIVTGQPADLGAFNRTAAYATLADWEMRYIAAWDAPYPDAIAAGDAVEIALTGDAGAATLTRGLLDNYGHYPRVFAATLANLRLIRSACAVERYRLTHGELPRTLDDLVPDYLDAVPADPFDGQPLRYAPAGAAAYTLHSIGMNQTDDGGQPGEHRSGDIVIEVLR